MLWPITFFKQAVYALKNDKILFLIKAIVALPALDSDRIYQLFCLEVYFKAATKFRKSFFIHIAMGNKAQRIQNVFQV